MSTTPAMRSAKRRSMIFVDIADPHVAPLPPARVERRATHCVHTPQPAGYMDWHEWATIASKTHRQVSCPHCGRWAIWLPKAEAREVNKRDNAEKRAFLRRARYIEQKRRAALALPLTPPAAPSGQE